MLDGASGAAEQLGQTIVETTRLPLEIQFGCLAPQRRATDKNFGRVLRLDGHDLPTACVLFAWRDDPKRLGRHVAHDSLTPTSLSTYEQRYVLGSLLPGNIQKPGMLDQAGLDPQQVDRSGKMREGNMQRFKSASCGRRSV